MLAFVHPSDLSVEPLWFCLLWMLHEREEEHFFLQLKFLGWRGKLGSIQELDGTTPARKVHLRQLGHLLLYVCCT